MGQEMGVQGSHRERPSPPPRWLEIAIAALGVAGLVLFVLFYPRAFPSASLDLELTRAQIEARANEYLKARGYDLHDLTFALTFEESWSASIYLQQLVGIPRTNVLARQEHLPLWLWQARWFRPLQKEGFYMSLMPDGTIASLTYTMLEEAPGADLPHARAQALAEAYLAEDRGWDLDKWELVSASTETMPGGRADHHFSWRRIDWDVGTSELRLAVDVQGDAIGGYGYWLRVPESFLRRFSEQRNRAGFINDLSFYLGVGGFGVVAVVFYALGHKRGLYPWRAGLVPGLAVAGVDLLAALNALPLRKAWYGTTQGYAVFWIEQVIDVSINALAIVGGVAILWTGGRYLARKVWKWQDKVLARRKDPWRTLSRSWWRGLMVGGAQAGYVVLFYVVATQLLGGWAPMGAPAVDLYATPLPFLAPLAAGVTPAVVEEFLFRLIGVGILVLIARRRWLAVLVPAVLWAFAHLSYVRDPIYLRGLELTLVGLLLGVVFLRFDLTTAIVAHLAYNVGVTAMPLLRAGHPLYVLHGALALGLLAVPMLPGVVRALRQGRARDEGAPSPEVRPAMPQDVVALEQLCGSGLDWSDWIADECSVVLCLWSGGETVGAAAGRVNADDVGQVYLLFVAPGWRRRYWGSLLAEALGRALLDKGVRSVQVSVRAEDWACARFWDTLGWRPKGTIYAHPGLEE